MRNISGLKQIQEKVQKYIPSKMELLRYLVGGFGAAAVNYTLFLLCSSFLGIHYTFSMVFATVVTWIYSFFVNKFLVFRAKTKRMFRESILFALQQIILFGISLLLMGFFVDILNIPKWFSWLIVAGIMMVLNFAGMKIFIWKV